MARDMAERCRRDSQRYGLMDEHIINLAKELLNATRTQREFLQADNMEAVDVLLKRCAKLTDELSDALTTNPPPPELSAILAETAKLTEEHTRIAIAMRGELSAEFTALRQSFETAGAYESAGVSNSDGLGSFLDGNA